MTKKIRRVPETKAETTKMGRAMDGQQLMALTHDKKLKINNCLTI